MLVRQQYHCQGWIMVFPVQPSDQEAKCRMAVNGYSTVKKSEAATIDNKDDDNGFFDAGGIVHHEFVPQGRTVNHEVYMSILRCMREALRCHRPDLWASGQWTVLHDNARPHAALSVSRFLTKHNVTVLPHPPYSPDLSLCDFFVSMTKKRLKGWRHENIEAIQAAATMELTGIHQLLSGLAETLATVYWLRRELLRRGQEALVVRLNFVFFTDSVSELYGQRMYTSDSDVHVAMVHYLRDQPRELFVGGICQLMYMLLSKWLWWFLLTVAVPLPNLYLEQV